MGATAFYAWPYPEKTDSVDVARDIKALADKLETMKTGFAVPDGGMAVGRTDVDSARDAQRKLLLRNKPGAGWDLGHNTQVEFSAYDSNIPGFMRLLVDGVTKSEWCFGANGDLMIYSGSPLVGRWLPFAVFTSFAAVPVTNSAFGSVAITFPTGRFTQAPLVFATCFIGNMQWIASVTVSNTTGCTIGVMNYQATVSNGPVTTNYLAIQMVSSQAPGRVVPQMSSPFNATVTCRTDDCENRDVALPMHLADDNMPVECGPCGEPINDITALTKGKD